MIRDRVREFSPDNAEAYRMVPKSGNLLHLRETLRGSNERTVSCRARAKFSATFGQLNFSSTMFLADVPIRFRSVAARSREITESAKSLGVSASRMLSPVWTGKPSAPTDVE